MTSSSHSKSSTPTEQELKNHVTKLSNALKALVLSPDTKSFLLGHDPKALEQARNALKGVEVAELV